MNAGCGLPLLICVYESAVKYISAMNGTERNIEKRFFFLKMRIRNPSRARNAPNGTMAKVPLPIPMYSPALAMNPLIAAGSEDAR